MAEDLRVQKGHQIVSLLHPTNARRNLAHLIEFILRPRRDLNPCYRRERSRSGPEDKAV